MKRLYLAFFLALLFAGCSKDLGNYDYTELQELTITVPYTSYQVGIGETLAITPEVKTEISELDLTYQWEIGYTPAHSQYSFLKFAEGKDLNFVCKLFEYMKSPGSYSIRLHVIQKSNGRSFYSPVISLSVTSKISGLVVLHGDDNQSDIALLKATDFLVNQGSIATSLIPNLYSSVNGEKIPGKGVSIIQTITYFLNNADRATVVAITDKGGVWAKYADLAKGGDWNSMFNSGINSGKPQFYTTQDQAVYAVDNGVLFPRNNNSYNIFPIPGIGTTQYYAASPFFYTKSGRVQGFFFDKNTRGFVETTNLNAYTSFSSSASNYFKQIVTSRYFNLAAMNADLVYMDKGGLGGHYLAVMKDDGGNRYLAEINWSASYDADIPAARYDMSVLPDINNAKFYAFGDDQVAMCYYATPSKVYRFTASPGNDLSSAYNELKMEDGTPITFDGEITMMKILKPLKNSSGLKVQYYNYNRILLVGVYKNGHGTLYSMNVNQATGGVISYTTFAGFEKIYDANIKGL
jgi:hypothetical protein